MDMQTFSCKCIQTYKCFNLTDEECEKGGPFTYVKGRIYNCVVIPNDYWGDCYVVTENITDFSMGFDKKKFDLYFKKID